MPLIKVVLDTNVIVSAHLTGGGLEAFVLDLALASKLGLYVSSEILAEYEEVLRRPLFRIDPKKVTQSLRLIKKQAKSVKPTRTLSVSPDPDDNRFLECAEAAGSRLPRNRKQTAFSVGASEDVGCEREAIDRDHHARPQAIEGQRPRLHQVSIRVKTWDDFPC